MNIKQRFEQWFFDSPTTGWGMFAGFVTIALVWATIINFVRYIDLIPARTEIDGLAASVFFVVLVYATWIPCVALIVTSKKNRKLRQFHTICNHCHGRGWMPKPTETESNPDGE